MAMSYVAVGPICASSPNWMETSRSGTVPHIGPYSFAPEGDMLTFKQRGGEILKDAWFRINDSQNRATKKQSTTILLRNFYVGVTSWNRFFYILLSMGIS